MESVIMLAKSLSLLHPLRHNIGHLCWNLWELGEDVYILSVPYHLYNNSILLVYVFTFLSGPK